MATPAPIPQPLIKGRLRLHAKGHIPLATVRLYLGNLELAYNALHLLDRNPYFFAELIHLPDYLRERALSESLARVSSGEEALILSAVELHSPGWWEIIGDFNILKQIRGFLNDAHKRRTEAAKLPYELRQKELENKALELDLVTKKIRILKEAGVSEEELRKLLESFMSRPLAELAESQQQEVLTGATVRVLKDDNRKAG